jgi:hypothetical protein
VGKQFKDVREVVVWGRLWELHGRDAPWKGGGQKSAEQGVSGWDFVGAPDESTLTLGDVESKEKCRKHCEKRSRTCLAWTWDEAAKLCHVSAWMSVGEEAKGRVSGVNVKRAKRLAAKCGL